MIPAVVYLLPLTIPLTVLAGAAKGGWFTFETLFWVFVALPVADRLVGLRRRNPTAAQARDLARSWRYRLVTWSWLPVHVALVAWALGLVAARDPTAVEWLGLTLSLGVTCGTVGITVAHELMHRPGRVDRALAEGLMMLTSYSHFCIEHVHGHHRRVATPDDPATARAGENLYRFWPRTVFGGIASAWALERARLGRRGRPLFSADNRMLRYGAELALLYLVIGASYGPAGVVLFAGQSLVAITTLEVVNYLEHYGLVRGRASDGRFEPVGPRHAWDSSHLISNLYLFNLGRHSDHHLRAGRPYHLLRHDGRAPQLPWGYGTMFLIALVPPLWRRIMDPRVAAWRRGAPNK